MKKGFTLIELLGVIVILGTIGLIIVPTVQIVLSNSSQKLCEDQIKIFERAAKNYVSQNPYMEYDSVSLETLQKEGFLEESDLKNPKGQTFDKESIVNITYDSNNNKYKFKYNGSCND